MQFTGEYLDATPGLYHLRARQYDPAVGRFTAADPVAPAVTDPYVAAYAYVNNRPTVLVDPAGLKPNRWVDLALAGYAAFDAFVAYGTAVTVGGICVTSDLIAGPLAIAAATPACAATVVGGSAAGYLESRAAGSKFYDFLHPDDAELNSRPIQPIKK
jgi:RHS repeat-associated protein